MLTTVPSVHTTPSKIRVVIGRRRSHATTTFDDAIIMPVLAPQASFFARGGRMGAPTPFRSDIRVDLPVRYGAAVVVAFRVWPAQAPGEAPAV